MTLSLENPGAEAPFPLAILRGPEGPRFHELPCRPPEMRQAASLQHQRVCKELRFNELARRQALSRNYRR